VAPDQKQVLAGLRRPDLFTVVLDQFMTDTAMHADIVLPATTFLEHTDLYLAYGHYYLQLARPAVARPGEVRSNVEIFRSLAERMGFEDPCFADSEDDMIRTLLNTNSEFLDGLTLEELEEKRSVRLNVPSLPFANGGFRTASGKFGFGAESLQYTPPAESRQGDSELRARYPLELISAKNDDNMNSTFGHRAAVDEQASILAIHPVDAAARQLKSGMPVKLFNDRGYCFRSLIISDRVKPGVVYTPGVRWSKTSCGGLGVNQLTSQRLTDLGGGATFYSCLVEVAQAK
jgi:anaerobic selenocysteine-containing dehydrogenase